MTFCARLIIKDLLCKATQTKNFINKILVSFIIRKLLKLFATMYFLTTSMHILQPKHTKLKEKEAQELLDKLNISKAQLPKIYFIEEISWEISALFNPNEYPDSFKDLIDSCAIRYSAVLTNAKNTITEINKRRAKNFAKELGELNKSIPSLKQDFFVEFSCSQVILNFEAFLISSKSLLDVLCRLLSSQIPNKVMGFNRTGPKNAPIYGGRVLNILKNTAKSDLPLRDKLVELIESHKTEWIDILISMRDEVVHFGKLEGFVNFWTVIKNGRKDPYTDDDIFSPDLKDLGPAEQYIQQTLPKITKFTVTFHDMIFPKSSIKGEEPRQ